MAKKNKYRTIEITSLNYSSVVGVIKILEDAVTVATEQYDGVDRNEIELNIEHDDNYGGVIYTIEFRSLETDKEYKDRLAKEKAKKDSRLKIRAAKEKRERAEYERLKAKFEGK